MRRSARAIVLGLAALHAGPAAAQSRHLLLVAGGLGLTRPASERVEGSGSGGYGEVEYVYRPVEWFAPRSYAGVLITRPEQDCGVGVSPCDVSSRIFFLGAKVRLMAPIPWVGPFAEIGLGASVGRLSTRSGQAVDVTARGVMVHVPWAVGLALGARREFELSFQYLQHTAQKQVGGAVALGLAFELD